MKKLSKIICCLVMPVFLLAFSFLPTKTVKAANFDTSTAFNNEINQILNEYAEIKNRVAGSDGEKQAYDYIINYLTNQTVLQPKNDVHVSNGVQTFTFLSKFTSLYETSRNIVYTYSSAASSDKKVVISCHYDAVAYKLDDYQTNENIVASESINGSAGSVATLLALAKELPNLNLKYNIEIAFFGAGESNNAGSEFFTRGYSDEEKANVVCHIDFDGIAVGKYVNFYVDEIDNSFSDLITKISTDNKYKVSKVDVLHLNKYLLEADNELGYDYYHVAMVGDNLNFKKNGIMSVKFFAGEYSNGVVIGKCEYADKDLVTFTENDNREYITENYGADAVTKNLYEVFKTTSAMLSSEELAGAVSSAKSTMNSFNMIFANSKLAFYLTVVFFVLFVIIAMYVYYKLSIKAYKANVEVEFLSSVMKISEEVSGNEVNENTAKVVSQILANDIKKDKMLKPKKNKKNKGK